MLEEEAERAGKGGCVRDRAAARGGTGCDNGKGTRSSHENWGSIALLTLSPAKTQDNTAEAGMSRGLEALVLRLCPCCLPGLADPMDVQQQPLLRALQG